MVYLSIMRNTLDNLNNKVKKEGGKNEENNDK